MDITQQELQEQYYKTIEGILVMPIFNHDGFNQKTGTYSNVVILKTADEVHQENLELRNKQAQPTDQQIINAKLLQDNANLKTELEKQQQFNAQILIQMAQGGNANA